MERDSKSPECILRTVRLYHNSVYPSSNVPIRGDPPLDGEIIDIEDFEEKGSFEMSVIEMVRSPPAVLIGTVNGCVYEYTLTHEKDEKDGRMKTRVFRGQRMRFRAAAKPVKKLVYVETHRILLVLIDREVHALVYPGLTPVLETSTKIYDRCVDLLYHSEDGQESYVFFDSKFLLFCAITANGLNIHDKVECNVKEVKCMLQMGSRMIFGSEEGYINIDLVTLEQKLLIKNSDSTQRPLIVKTGHDELLLLVVTHYSTFMGVLVDSMGAPTRGTINWAAPVVSVQLYRSLLFTLLVNSVIVVHELKGLIEIGQIMITPRIEPLRLANILGFDCVPTPGVALACRGSVYIVYLSSSPAIFDNLLKANDYVRSVIVSSFLSDSASGNQYYFNLNCRILLKAFSEEYLSLRPKRAFNYLCDVTVDPRILISLFESFCSVFSIPTIETILEKLLLDYDKSREHEALDSDMLNSLPLAAILPRIGLNSLLVKKYTKESNEYGLIVKEASEQLSCYMHVIRKRHSCNNNGNDMPSHILFHKEMNEAFPDINNDPMFYASFYIILTLWDAHNYVGAVDSLRFIPKDSVEECFTLMSTCNVSRWA